MFHFLKLLKDLFRTKLTQRIPPSRAAIKRQASPPSMILWNKTAMADVFPLGARDRGFLSQWIEA
jgi:hypothetical protein